MGHQAQVKLMRRQIRNVAQEHYQSALTAESIEMFDKKFTAHAESRLDKIAQNTTNEVRKMDGQTREFRRLLMTDVGMQLSRELFEINVTMISWQRTLLRELGMGAEIDSFEKKVEEEKKEVRTKLEAEAEVKRAAQEAEAKTKAAEESAAAKLKAETEGTPVDAIPAEATTTTEESLQETA